MDYTITLTDTEQKSMEYIAVDVDAWITNAAKVRASRAREQIIALNTAHCNANSIAIELALQCAVLRAIICSLALDALTFAAFVIHASTSTAIYSIDFCSVSVRVIV